MPAADLPALTPKQTKVLVVLRSEARALTNKDLRSLGIAPLKKTESEKLAALGLVTTDSSHHAHSYTLTAHGLEVAGQLEMPESPRRPKPPGTVYDHGLPKLSPSQVLALVVLMAEARQLTNTELTALAGFTLTGADNTTLEKTLGLVETDRSQKPFAHQLTDKGWALVRRLHLMQPPNESKSATRTLLTLLRNIDRSLEQLQSTHGVKLSHGEFFRQQQHATNEGADPEAQVRTAYAVLAPQPGDWVGLADLRDRLPGLTKAEVDAALLALLDQDGVRIIPVANTKALSARDRAAAVDIGGEDSHVLSIGRP